MTPSHDLFSKRFATVRFIMGSAFKDHFVDRGQKPETIGRVIATARRRFMVKRLNVVLDPKSVQLIGSPGAFTGFAIIARIDGIEQKIVMDTAIAARRMAGQA